MIYRTVVFKNFAKLETADLVTYAETIFKGKLHFLFCECLSLEENATAVSLNSK